jgi:hypothetical protein
LEQEYEQVRVRERLHLTEQDRREILALARDLPSVWHASTTSHADRKNLLRMLIREVVLQPIEVPRRATRIRVLWQTGSVSELIVPRPGPGECVATPPEVLDRIRTLAAQGHSDREIMEALNREGHRSGRRRPFTLAAIGSLRFKYRIPSAAKPVLVGPLPDQREDGLYSLRGVARDMGVPEHIVRDWQSRGLIKAERGRYRSWWFVLDQATRKRLRAAKTKGKRRAAGAHSQPRTGKKVQYA